MKIRHKLKNHFYFVKAEDSVEAARNLMSQHKIRHLPVLCNGHIIGIFSDRDLAMHPQSSTANFMPVKSLMTEEVICCGVDTSIRDVCKKMLSLKINALPVTTKDGIMMGIVTTHDLLELLAEWDMARDQPMPFEFPIETLFAA